MKKIITTIILTSIIALIFGFFIYVFGEVYLNYFQNTTNDYIYQLDKITMEEPEKTESFDNKENTISISEIIQSPDSENKNQLDNNILNNNIDNMFFYNQLSNNQKKIYDKIRENKNNLKNGNYVIQFGNAFSDVLKNENGEEKLGNDYQTAIEAFMHDNIDLFYIDVNKMYLNIETSTKFLKTTYSVYITPATNSTYLSKEFDSMEKIEQAQQEIEKVKNYVLSNLKGNDYQKILMIHNYLVNSIEYDSTYSNIGTYNIYGALVKKKCVCEGYAKAFKYLVNSAGIECEILQGTATNTSGTTESHAWNCVKINETWYQVDTTWDDPIIIGNNGKSTDEMRYKYFLKGTTTFEKDHILEYRFSENGYEFSYPNLSLIDY